MIPAELNKLLAEIEQLFANGKWHAAEQAVNQLIAVAPNDRCTWAYRGAIHLHAGQMQEAEKCFRQATALDTHDKASWHHLSMVLQSQGRLAEAEFAARQAVAIDASQAPFLLQLGNVLFAQRKLSDATEAFQKSVQLDRFNVTAWNNLAAAHHVQKNWLAARDAYEASLALQPNELQTRLKLIDVIERTMSYSSAEKMAQQVTVHYPQSAEAWSVLGRIQLNLAKQAEAIQALRHAIEIEPSPHRHSRLLQALQYEQHVEPASLLAQHEAWNQKYAASVRRQNSATSFHPPLRIGFVSSDFGVSPVGHMVLPLLKSLDKRRCSVTCYFDNREEDRLTPEFRSAVDEWRVTFGLPDEALAAQIQADNINVLIDLMGHAGNRLLVFALQSAPIQITWFGYVGTTGLKTMDYLLADRFHVRPGEEHNYSETVLRMPHGYACYGAPAYAPPISRLPARSTGHVTFGCFNNPAKWSPFSIDNWTEILRKVPTAQLLLKYYGLHDPRTQNLFRAQFRERGIESQRILLEGWSEHKELLNAYNRVDVALDTQPYSGGVTTCEAIWMGVPVITWPGKTFAGRHATSHLTNAGLEQFIARDQSEFVSMSIDWANRLDELAVIRSTMRDQMIQSPLCDAQTFAADFLVLLNDIVSQARHQ
ncbi:MAG TPA: tetratricopeptide repeat protein [Pirellulaceae bacterium]|jgi:predicted O-linked N-acetylglucosamine transferase (SPINDLY family)